MRGPRPALFVALIVLVAPAAACTGTPTSPSPTTPPGTVDVAGDWSGTWTYSTAGVIVAEEVTVRLSQSGAAASGSWMAESGAAGQIAFDAAAGLAGTLTLSQARLGGSPCNASTTISGSAAADRLDITVANIPAQGICHWGTGGRFVLTR